MGSLPALLIASLMITHCVTGLILLKPGADTHDLLDYEEFPDSELFDTLVDMSKSDLSANRYRLQVRPFEPNDVSYDDDDYYDDHDIYEEGDVMMTPPADVPAFSDSYAAYDNVDDDNVATALTSLHRRGKRSVVDQVDAKVEVLVVVDNAIYQHYVEKTRTQREALAMLRSYYGMVFAMVDQRFKTIADPELSIAVKISGILVSESRQDSAWLEYLVQWSRRRDEGRVNAHKALKYFIKWLKDQKNLPKYDHAMAFTGYHLVNKASIDLGGMAYVSSVCNTRDGNSASMVADPGDFQVVKVAAHELAHSLGASHDGDKENKDCPPEDNFIMAPQTTSEHNKLKNAFYFSPCSVRQMKKLLGSEQAACVRDTPTVYYEYNLQRLPPGQKYSADQQCKLIFGKKSEFCGTKNLKMVMCGQLWCKDPENGLTCRTHSYLTALPGTTCREGKVCHLGVCQTNPYGRRPTGRMQISRTPSQTNRRQSTNRRTSRLRRPGNRQGRRRQNNSRRQLSRISGGRRGRNRGRSSKQRGQCLADQNKTYCEGLIKVNPRVCRRRAVRKYCCQTCVFRRRRL
ncbi:A disintegrin and metalloproteinase with thrombospondin motifs 16-like [Haliotis rubra]|uniref:A disintegrin and metalloproteinase with thrombospondin motifs 16-like n=1 Tax=Haliotis rubra TaxID=36100 RepID=UPI001EE6013B|nr:A disintegrin and metalloproteinase with thrombospondin motifs 16-like [Haliotis rubra]